MRAVMGPRWLGLVILLSLGACGAAVMTSSSGPDIALLRSLSARLPFAAAGTVAAPVLSGVLGVGFGLLVTRRDGWADQRLRALILAGGAVCLVWLTLVSAFWFAVQGEILPLLADEPAARAGLGALSTLLIPSTVVVFGGAVAIAVHVRAATRIAAAEGHVHTARSRGLPTTGLVVRRALRRALPAVMAVQLVEFLVLYGGSLAVQAAFTTPIPGDSSPGAAAPDSALFPLLPAESLPLVLAALLLGIVSFVVAGVALATTTPATALSVLHRTTSAGAGAGADIIANRTANAGRAGLFPSSRSRPADAVPPVPTLPSTEFRAADFLDIRDLRTHTIGERSGREPLGGVSLTVPRGQTLAVIGDDPDSTSLLCHSIAGMQHSGPAAMSGSILCDGIELVGLNERDFRNLRGRHIGFLPAPAADHLDPDARIGQHLMALLHRRTHLTRAQARSAAVALLARAGLADAESVFAAYPGRMSTVTCQRVLLAGVLAGEPQLVVADDPTRGFGAADEAEFLDLLHSLQRERGFTLIVASARVGIARRCDRVAILSDGAIVEYASVPELLTAPQHPYTRRLLARVAGTTGS